MAFGYILRYEQNTCIEKELLKSGSFRLSINKEYGDNHYSIPEAVGYY